jgi:glycosyltransferase involved in cell wall biosynthesis
MTTPPRVSVVMTVWNGEKYIAESIDSILKQTWRDLEFIIIDDGSTDGTCGVIESFRDDRIRLVRRPHAGVVLSANHGVSLARGEYVARLDADDISLPTRLALQVAALDRHPAAVLCYTDVEIFGDNMFGDVSKSHRAARFTRDTATSLIQMCFRCTFTHSSVMFRLETWREIGGYRDKHPCEDFDLYGRLARVGNFVGVPGRLVRYRRHGESATMRRLEQMGKFSHEICIAHALHFLAVSEAQAEAIYGNMHRPVADRDWGLWFFFCARSLRHPRCWRPEPLGWLVSQTLRLLAAKLGRKKTAPATG